MEKLHLFSQKELVDQIVPMLELLVRILGELVVCDEGAGMTLR